MTLKYQALAVVAVATLAPLAAFAQAVTSSPSVSISSSPSGTIYAPGSTGVGFGTVTFAASSPGTAQVSSLPFNVTGTNGATAGNLGSCSLVNANGTTLNTGNNALTSISTGTNTFTFDQPISVTYGSPVTLTERCNINSGAPMSAAYTFGFGTPAYPSSLVTYLHVIPSIYAGSVNYPVAEVFLNSSTAGNNASVTSVPLTATFNNGLTPGEITSCALYSNGSPVSTNTNGILNAGLNTFTLNSYGIVGGAGSATLTLDCAVATNAPIGGSVTLALAPNGILATNSSTGASVTPAQGLDPATGNAGTLSGTATVVGTTSGETTGTGGTTTPTPPNTGAGAAAPLAAMLLGLSALAVTLGVALYKRA